MFIHASAVGPVEDGGESESVEFGSDHRQPDHLPNRILRPVDPREYFQLSHRRSLFDEDPK